MVPVIPPFFSPDPSLADLQREEEEEEEVVEAVVVLFQVESSLSFLLFIGQMKKNARCSNVAMLGNSFLL